MPKPVLVGALFRLEPDVVRAFGRDLWPARPAGDRKVTMAYEELDPAITAWATEHALHVFKTYRDVEVRTVDVVGRSGKRCQIWIDQADERGAIHVHVWDRARRRHDFETSAIDLPRCLEDAYALAATWV